MRHRVDATTDQPTVHHPLCKRRCRRHFAICSQKSWRFSFPLKQTSPLHQTGCTTPRSCSPIVIVRPSPSSSRCGGILSVPLGGGLAQLGERLLCKQDVRGSSPLASTIGSQSIPETRVTQCSEDIGDTLLAHELAEFDACIFVHPFGVEPVYCSHASVDCGGLDSHARGGEPRGSAKDDPFRPPR